MCCNLNFSRYSYEHAIFIYSIYLYQSYKCISCQGARALKKDVERAERRAQEVTDAASQKLERGAEATAALQRECAALRSKLAAASTQMSQSVKKQTRGKEVPQETKVKQVRGREREQEVRSELEPRRQDAASEQHRVARAARYGYTERQEKSGVEDTQSNGAVDTSVMEEDDVATGRAEGDEGRRVRAGFKTSVGEGDATSRSTRSRHTPKAAPKAAPAARVVREGLTLAERKAEIAALRAAELEAALAAARAKRASKRSSKG